MRIQRWQLYAHAPLQRVSRGQVPGLRIQGRQLHALLHWVLQGQVPGLRIQGQQLTQHF